jgi:glutamate--cysteine ligase
MFDWINHLTTIYTDVRMKTFLEMRGADVGPAPLIKALPALWAGIFYDDAALDGALEIIKGWSVDDIKDARREVPRAGLSHGIQGRKFSDVAAKLVALAGQGLKSRNKRDASGADESRYLEPLSNILASGQTEAERLISLCHKEWGGDIRSIYRESRL